MRDRIERTARQLVLLVTLFTAAASCDDPATTAQDASSDTGPAEPDAMPGADASRPDAATEPDAGARDAGSTDAGRRDSATNDAATDRGEHDAASADAGVGDAAAVDAGPEDAASSDASSDPDDAGSESDAATDAGEPAPEPDEDTFELRVVLLGLEAPWEITWGPDDRLWITERTGLRVVRVDPASGDQTVALVLSDAHQSSGQDGLLGMALDPRLGQENGGDYVYLAYTYDAAAGPDLERRARIVRYTYSALSESLGSPVVLVEGLPASNDHNSGRLVYGPDDRLYYTIGDQGHNQFDNMCLAVRAQQLPTQTEIDQEDWSRYQGKILRLALDGSIPPDNPEIGGVRSHIYSYGHRNAQGIAFGPDAKLYASEQGPKTDDELNWIRPGENYGWPHVAGYRDDQAYVYGNWSASSPEPCASLWFSDYDFPPSVPVELESAWSGDFVAPLQTFFTVDNDFDFTDPACAGSEYICWPTIAPSSLELYVAGSNGLTTWGTSLLVPSLKRGSVFRVRLSADGTATTGEAVELFKTTNRYRDLTVAPDKRTFYVVTDDIGTTSGPTTGSTQLLEHRGAVLEFTR